MPRVSYRPSTVAADVDPRVLPPDETSGYERKYEEIDDLVLMDDGAGVQDISDVLSTRYQAGNMYTSVGPVLIATNPYQLNTKPSSCTEGGVRSIYDDAVAIHYYNSAATEVGPHIYGVGSAAYKALTTSTKNQCIIVSGESGAGKTEAAKQLMQFVTIICDDSAGKTLAARKNKSAMKAKSMAGGIKLDEVTFEVDKTSRMMTPAERVKRSLAKVNKGATVNKELAKRANRRQAKGAKPKKMAAPVAKVIVDGDVKEAFEEMKNEAGKVTKEILEALDDFQGAINDGIIPEDFLGELFKQCAVKASDSSETGLGVQGLQLFLKASEAEISLVQDEDEELARKKAGDDNGRKGSALMDIGSGLSLRAKLEDIEPIGNAANPLQMRELEDVKEQLLQSNPVLEAFGNAKTVRNDNSSRFGKYMELQFSYKGKVIGGKVYSYLLEKARVAYQAPNERSFHIFYALIHGTDDNQKEQLRLGAPETYGFLMNENRLVPGMDDSEHYEELSDAMETIGIAEADRMNIFSTLAAIISLGNIEFEDKEGYSRATPKDPEALNICAALMQVPPDSLELALAQHELKKIGGRNSVTMVSMDAVEATANRDTLAKELYKRVFSFVVDRVNAQIDYQGETILMGILDIYGFEIFTSNSLEQFLINYVNESLQQYFIELTLRTEQEEYEAEGIEWEAVEYFDNAPVVALIEGKTKSIFALLNEQANFKSANTKTLLDSFTGQLKTHSQFIEPVTLKSDVSFGIKHYAGDVEYNVEAFISKNADTMYFDLKRLCASADNKLIKMLFTPDIEAGESGKRPPTITTQFKAQIKELMTTLKACSPHYVRCIKPNEQKTPGLVEPDRMLHQVQYLNVKENVAVRRAGFCFRMEYGLFANRFKAVCASTWPSSDGDAKAATTTILTSGEPAVWADPFHPMGGNVELKLKKLVEGTDFKLGKTKVFIKDPKTLFVLETARQAVIPSVASRLQASARRFVYTCLYKRMYIGFVKLQAQIRAFLGQLHYHTTLTQIEGMQSVIRGFNSRAATKKFRVQFNNKAPRTYANKVQCLWRSRKCREKLPADMRAKLLASGVIIKEARARYNASTAIGAMYRQRAASNEYKRKRLAIMRCETKMRQVLAKIRARKLRQAEFDQMMAALRGDGVKITKFSHNRNPLSAKISIHTSHHTFKLVDDDTRIVWLGGGMFSKGKTGELVSDISGMKRGLHPELETDKMTRDTEVKEEARHFSILFNDGKYVFLRASSEWERERLFRVFSHLTKMSHEELEERHDSTVTTPKA